jgi:hypothetical protein
MENNTTFEQWLEFYTAQTLLELCSDNSILFAKNSDTQYEAFIRALLDKVNEENRRVSQIYA